MVRSTAEPVEPRAEAKGAKDLEIFKEAVPQVTRIGVLWNPTTPSHPLALKAVEAAGEKLGVAILTVPVRTVEDFDKGFMTMARERTDGFHVISSPEPAASLPPLSMPGPPR